MQYFDFLSMGEKEELFFSQPKEFNKDDEKGILSYGLGATMYVPATKKSISADLINHKFKSLISMVLCLEDAIGDLEVEHAESMLTNHITKLVTFLSHDTDGKKKMPMLFIRVRDIAQMRRLSSGLGEKLHIVTGFVFPKITTSNCKDYFETLISINQIYNLNLYAMPILESSQIIYKETRTKTLMQLHDVLFEYKDRILNIRIGATDFSSYFGVRRSPQLTIYDIGIIRDCIIDILNFFCRVDTSFVVSGPVWEYFEARDSHRFGDRRYSNRYVDGLINEALLDKANGLVGKTIIHPSHIVPIQSLYVVSHEEYLDAKSIIDHNDGQVGVLKSAHNNKMNEIKPHLNWAKKTIILSEIYGVFNEGKDYSDLLSKDPAIQNIRQAQGRHNRRKQSL